MDKTHEELGLEGKNDWMAEELRYEARHSVWDIDDRAENVEKLHHANCDARIIEQTHQENCDAERVKVYNPKPTIKMPRFTSRPIELMYKFIAIFVAMFFFFLMFIMALFN